MTWQLNNGVAVAEAKQVNSSEATTFNKSVSMSSGAVVFSKSVSVAELRFQRLLRYRNVFGALSLALLAVLLASLWFHIRYEPSAALLSCVVGTFLVFVMKVSDARK